MPRFPKSMTSDQMAEWLIAMGSRNAFGKMDYNDAKEIAGASDVWTIERIPVGTFGWVWPRRPKTWGVPPVVLKVGPGEYEVLDGKHRIGYANHVGERDIPVYLGRAMSVNPEVIGRRICSHCKKDMGPTAPLPENTPLGLRDSHGICDDCLKVHYPEQYEIIKRKRMERNPMGRFGSGRLARFNPREAVMVARARGNISGRLRGEYVKMPVSKNVETVDMIAAGYEWICPNCDELNGFYEIPKDGYVMCVNCERVFEVSEAEHAYP